MRHLEEGLIFNVKHIKITLSSTLKSYKIFYGHLKAYIKMCKI